MVPVVTGVPNIRNISCWKTAPKPLVYIGPRISLFYSIFILGKQFKIESMEIFQLLDYSKKIMFILSTGTSLFEVLPLCFHKSHHLK